MFALRRANKNRRNQLRHATNEKKERIVNSLIPGVDYSRAPVTHANAATSQGLIFDSSGNQLQAINESQLESSSTKKITQQGATLLIPEELMQKMRLEGFMVLEPRTGTADKISKEMQDKQKQTTDSAPQDYVESSCSSPAPLLKQTNIAQGGSQVSAGSESVKKLTVDSEIRGTKPASTQNVLEAQILREVVVRS